MTEADFLDYVAQCIREMPEAEALESYLRANAIKLDTMVSEEKADELEQLQGISITTAATNLNTGNTWPMVFRSRMLDAPLNVIRPIVIHECIHMLLVPVLHPRNEQVPLTHETFKRLRTIRNKFDRNKLSKPPFPLGCDYEELLVTFIGLEWKTGEGAAHAWNTARKAS